VVYCGCVNKRMTGTASPLPTGEIQAGKMTLPRICRKVRALFMRQGHVAID
jgi:hypothetical protein